MKANFLEYTERTTCFKNKNAHSCIPCALVFPGSVFGWFTSQELGRVRSGAPRTHTGTPRLRNKVAKPTIHFLLCTSAGLPKEVLTGKESSPGPSSLQRPGEQPRGAGDIASASRHLSRARFYAVPQAQVSDPRLHPQPTAGPGKAHLPYNSFPPHPHPNPSIRQSAICHSPALPSLPVATGPMFSHNPPRLLLQSHISPGSQTSTQEILTEELDTTDMRRLPLGGRTLSTLFATGTSATKAGLGLCWEHKDGDLNCPKDPIQEAPQLSVSGSEP